MLQIKRASQNFPEILQSTDYQALINIKVLPQIDPHSTITKWVAIEARWDHELIGLALCEIYPLLRAAELKSINIKSNFRQKGIGRQLFAFLEDWLVQKEQVQSIEVIYDQSEPECIYLEKILIAQGWDIPNVSILRCHFDSLTFNPPWLHYSSRLPTFINFFSWSDLSTKDRIHIEYLGKQGRFLPTLSPFRDEHLIDLRTSVGLYHRGKVSGWCITRRPNPSTVRYSSLFVDHHLLHYGYGIQLLAESIKRQKNLAIPEGIFDVNLREIDKSWWHFVKKRLMPLSKKIDRIKRAIKIYTIYLT